MPTVIIRETEARIVQIITPGPRGPVGAPGEEALGATYTAQGDINGHRAVSCPLAGYATLTNPATASLAHTLLGVAEHAAEDGAEITVRQYGTMSNPGWSFHAGPVFVINSVGEVGQTPPTSGYICQIGYAASPTTLFIRPEPAIQII